MRMKILISLLFFIKVTVACQEVKIICTSNLLTDKGPIKILAKLSNQGGSAIYVPISHWEVDGLVDTLDALRGFPGQSYVVNRIHFYPVAMRFKRIPYIGDKSDYPDYKEFPSLVKIRPGESREIMIELGEKISTILRNQEYVISSSIAYCFEQEWTGLKKTLGRDISRAIVSDSTQIKIQISDRRKVTHWINSNVKVNQDKSDLIREAFRNWLTAICSAPQ